MALMRKKEKSLPEISAKDLFTDRDIPRSAFLKSCMAFKQDRENASRRAIAWSGVGGIGKTALINFLQNAVETEKNYSTLNLKYIRYDFGQESTDPATALRTLRNMLAEKYDADFPLFDKGHLRYREKSGEYVTSEEINQILNTSHTFRKIKSKLESATATVDSVGTIGRFVSGLIDFTDQVTETSSVLKITKDAIKFFDSIVAKRAEEAKKKNDTEYAEIQNELAKRESVPESYALMEYLPRLFARDLTDWLEETDSKLLVFFDTYEQLTEDENDAKKHIKLMSINRDVDADWWIKDYIDDNMPGLVNVVPRVFWIFSGRNELTWAKELWDEDDDFQQFNLDNFSPNDSKKFLEKVGITDSKIVDGIIKLTSGSPMWLKLCRDVFNAQMLKGKVPTVEDFGKKREDIVKRLFNYMDSSAERMLQYLCIFGKWTDEIASRIIPNYSAETYKRVKKLSLVHSDDKVLEMFYFDRTTRNILLPYLAESTEHKVMFEEVEKVADRYFNEFFEKQLQAVRKKRRRASFRDEKTRGYFEIWAEIILETSFEPEELMERYEENLAKFADLFDISVRELVAEKFFAKIKNFNAPQSAPYAYFEHRSGAVKFARQNYSDALIFEESAYDKFKRLKLDDDELKYKIAVMKGLADVYNELKYYKKKVELCEEIWKASSKIFKSADDENIIDAMRNFADALEDCDRNKDAVEIHRKILERLEKFGDERTVDAEKEYAKSLSHIGRNEEAILHFEKAVELCKNLGDDEKTIRTLEDLCRIFRRSRKILRDTKYLEKKLSWQQEILNLYRKTREDKFDRNIRYSIDDISNTLEELGRKSEARKERENFAIELKKHIENFGKVDEETAEKMDNLATIIFMWMSSPEGTVWREKAKNLRREIVKEKTAKPIEDVEETISEIENLIGCLSSDLPAEYQEIIELRRKILSLAEENFDEEKILSEKEQLASDLRDRPEGYAEALNLFEEIAEQTKNLYGATDDTTVYAFRDVVQTLDNMGNKSAAFEKRKEILQILMDNDGDDQQILSALEDVADYCDGWDGIKNYNEALTWRKKILEFCREHFVADGPEVIDALENLTSTLDHLNLDSTAYKKELAAIKSENLSEEHRDSISAKEDIADNLHELGKYDEEIELRLQIIDLHKKNFEMNGDSRRWGNNIADAMENLAELYEDVGRKKDSFDMWKKIVEFYENKIAEGEENSPKTIKNLEEIADIFRWRHLDDSAGELRTLSRILEISEKIYSPSSDKIIDAKTKIADFYYYDRYKSLPINLEILEMRKEKFRKALSELSEDDEELIDLIEELAREFENLHFEEDATEKYVEALNLRRRIVKKLEKDFGETNEKVSVALDNLGRDLSRQDEYRESLKVWQRLTEIYKKKYDGDETQDDIIDSLDKQADKLNDLKKYSDELKIRRKIFELYCGQPHGKTSDNAIRALQDIADCYTAYSSLEDFVGGLKVYDEELLPLINEKYSSDETQKDFIRALDNKADIFKDTEDFDQALEIRRQIIELNRKKYNDTHDDVIRARKDYVRLLKDVGYFDKALEEQKNIVDLLTEKNSGELNEQLADEKKDLAELFKGCGKFDEACKFREEIYKLFKEKFGEESEKTLETLEECADAFDRAGNYEKALTFQQKLVNIVCKNFNPENSVEKVGSVLISLAKILEKCGRTDEALRERGRMVAETENLLNSTIEIYGENSEKTLEVLNTLASNLSDAERPEEELQTRERIKNICEKVYGKTSTKYIEAAEDVARFYDNNNLKEDALKARKEIADIRRELLNSYIKLVGTNHKHTISSRKELAEVLEEIGETEDAGKLLAENLNSFKEIAVRRREKFGDGHKITLQALNEYAENLEDRNNFKEALQIRCEIVTALKEKFADEEDAPEIIDALKEKADLLKSFKEYAEEEKIRREILNLCEKRFYFNLGYSETISALESLADCLQEVEKFDAAIKIRREIIKRLTEKYCGNNLHSEVITAKENLAETFETAKNYVAAVEEREKILEDLQKKFEGKQNGNVDISNAENQLHHAENLRDGIEEDEIFDETEVVENEFDESQESSENFEESRDDFDDLGELLKKADISESINLRKGQKADLTKNNPDLKNLVICFECKDSSGDEIEIDGSACVLYVGGKVKQDEDFIFYNNTLHESRSVEYVQISDGNESALKISLDKIPEDAEKIAFTLSIYEGDERGRNFSQISGATIRIINADTAKELMRFNLDDNFTVETGIVAGEVYRYKGEWKFNATGAGFVGGLESLCRNFGVAIE